MKLSLHPFSFLLRAPLATAHGLICERSGVLVRVEAQGVTGVGEATPLPAWGTQTLDEVREAVSRFHLPAMPHSLDEVGGLVDALAGTPAARCAVEGALLEWLAVTRGLSVAALLGAPLPRVLDMSALVDGDSALSLARQAHRAATRGFGTVKVKVGSRPLAADARRLMEVRAALGPSVRLRIDANGAWSEATARSALRGCEALALELCEQPVPGHDVEGLRRLRGRVGCALAADECLVDPRAIGRLLDRDPGPGVDVLVLKPVVLGGVLPALRLAREAEAAGVGAFVTSFLDGPVAQAMALHLAAALPGSRWAHGLATVEHLRGAEGVRPRRGQIRVTAEPGWGLPADHRRRTPRPTQLTALQAGDR